MMRNTLYRIGLVAILSGCTPGETNSKLKFIDPSSRGYSQSVQFSTSNAKMVFISGQVPVDTTGELVGKDDLEEQTEQVFKNIEAQVRKAGGTMNDVVKIDCYFTDISEISSFRIARDKYINLKKPPASTAVQVEQLINEEFLIEIDAVAVIN